MKKGIIIIGLLVIQFAKGQNKDSLAVERFTIHGQSTIIQQKKAGFNAPYSGDNSLLPSAESKTSITSTLFIGAKLWKNASFFVNPEIAGGSGLSEALGIAAATNGETFRIGDPAPKIYLARMFFRQIFSLSDNQTSSKDKYFHNHSDFNQLADFEPQKYFSITVGKVSISDYFDDNSYSHDPRTQFMSWGLMGNGAWDYPANTRGYTPSIILELITPKHELRYGYSLVPQVANGNSMDWKIGKTGAHTIEYTRKYNVNKRSGAVRFLTFYNIANMGNYATAIIQQPVNPNIENTRSYSNHKYGFGINVEQELTNELGFFGRCSWNDGKNETWHFTEIDRSLSLGFQLSGNQWHRKEDKIGLAYVISGLSKEHRDYLKNGGKGFILGDGNLNYAPEQLTEFYYTAQLTPNIFITGTYQLVINPGYNTDRNGPVHVFSIRSHFRF